MQDKRVPDVLSVVSVIGDELGVQFAGNGSGVAPVQHHWVEQCHAKHIESTLSQAPVDETFVIVEVPDIQRLKNQATGKLRTGTTRI